LEESKYSNKNSNKKEKKEEYRYGFSLLLRFLEESKSSNKNSNKKEKKEGIPVWLLSFITLFSTATANEIPHLSYGNMPNTTKAVNGIGPCVSKTKKQTQLKPFPPTS